MGHGRRKLTFEVTPATANALLHSMAHECLTRTRPGPDGPRKRDITLYQTRSSDTAVLPGQILAVAGVFSLIQRVSDTLNGRFAKKDAIT